MGRGASRKLNTVALYQAIDEVATKMKSGQHKKADKLPINTEIAKLYSEIANHRLSSYQDTGVHRIRHACARRLKALWGFKNTKRTKLNIEATEIFGKNIFENIGQWKWD